jgi:hypothetical protein
VSWLIGVGPLVGPLLCCGIGYLIGYRDARDKYAPKDGGS